MNTRNTMASSYHSNVKSTQNKGVAFLLFGTLILVSFPHAGSQLEIFQGRGIYRRVNTSQYIFIYRRVNKSQICLVATIPAMLTKNQVKAISILPGRSIYYLVGWLVGWLVKKNSFLTGDFIFMLNTDWMAKKQLNVNLINHFYKQQKNIQKKSELYKLTDLI